MLYSGRRRLPPMHVLSIIQLLCLIPIVGGSVYVLLCVLTVLRIQRTQPTSAGFTAVDWPAVTILKPVCGLEKGLGENLRSTCRQEYPRFQVVLSVQRPDDPAIPLLREVQAEFGADRVSVAIEQCTAGLNGKINNLLGAMKHARHDMLVISDSDIRLRPDYLKTIVAPLLDSDVGYVCTLYRAIQADTWYEALELLTINAELTPNMTFALVTGASQFCLGASTAIRRSTLNEIGGFVSLADYLVEDYEMGRRIWTGGKRAVILPYFVDTVVDLKTPNHWWNHLVYWDQNNKAARPWPVFLSVIVRPVPFAVVFALSTWGTWLGAGILGVTVAIRLLSAAIVMRYGLKDKEGPRWLWLLPFRDIAALGSWILAFTKRTTIWRETRFVLTGDGRLGLPEDVA